jgi:GT2 family glycosyltransferase
MSPKISVVIVTWNAQEIIEGCLKSIFATQYPNLEVIIVDNGSQDKTISLVKKFMSIRVIRNSSNVGFPKGVNIGLNQVTGYFILLLNADACLPPDFFQKGLSFFSNYPDAALMGPKLVDPNGASQGSVFPEPSIVDTIKEFWLGQKGLASKYTPTGDSPVSVNAISGACMFFSRHTLDLIGKLTEAVFMFYEDLDFCRRIRRSGWRVYFNPQIQVMHEHGHSTKKVSTLAQKYLRESSLWYNGPLKHYLMWFISYTGQKLFHRS